MKRESDMLNSERISKEILKALFPDKELSYNVLLNTLTQAHYKNKKTKISGKTLSKYLNILHQQKQISYYSNPKDKRITLYKLKNPQDLYPDVAAALMFRDFKFLWFECFKPVFGTSLVGEELNKELQRISDESVEKLEKELGKHILNLITIQTEKELPILEIITKFNKFLYLFIKQNKLLKESINKTTTSHQLKESLSISYSDIEKELIEDLKYDAHLSRYIKPGIISGNTDDLYNELGFPFSDLYKKKKND